MTSDFYENESISPEEEHIDSRQAFVRLLPLLKDHIGRLVVALVLLAGGTGFSLIWPVLLKNAIDGPLKDRDFSGLVYLAVAIALIQIGTIAATV